MIVKKIFVDSKGEGVFFTTWHITGWYLFGFIPLYVIKQKISR
jgi:hypothetical protein